MIRGEIRWYTFRLPDKRRPVLVLTRDEVIDRQTKSSSLPLPARSGIEDRGRSDGRRWYADRVCGEFRSSLIGSARSLRTRVMQFGWGALVRSARSVVDGLRLRTGLRVDHSTSRDSSFCGLGPDPLLHHPHFRRTLVFHRPAPVICDPFRGAIGEGAVTQPDMLTG